MRYTSKKNRVFLTILLFIGILGLYLFLRYIVPLHIPSPHPNRLTDITNKYGSCKWETEDGSVVMWVDKEMVERQGKVEYAFGTVNVNGESIPVYFRFAWTELNIIPITFFDGEEFEPEWDYVAHDYGTTDWRTKYAIGSKQMVIRKSGGENIENNFAVPDKWKLYLSEENLSKDEIKYPEICLPEYYNLYLQYEDIFEGKMTYEGFVEKYGICDTYLPYDYDPNSNTLPTWGEYVVQRNEFGKPMYYIAFNILENGNIYRPILVCTPE